MIRNGEPCWKQYIEGVFRDDNNKRVVYAEHQGIMFDFIEEGFRLGENKQAIMMPWGHGKTQSLGLYYPSFRYGLDPNTRFKICSSNESIATLRVGANKNTIDMNEDYQAIFPHIKQGDKWGESAFRLKGTAVSSTDYTMQAGGVFSSVIGGRADEMLLDDPLDLNNSLTEGNRQKTINSIEKMWLSRVTPDGRVLWIFTPMHREDAAMVITSNWRRLKICVSEDISCLEVYINDNLIKTIPLWEAMWSQERLLKFKEEIGTSAFDAGFRLLPASDEDLTFKHFEQCVRYNCDPHDFEYLAMWGGVDLSTKSRSGTVLELVGITKDMKRVLVDPVYLGDPVKIESVLWDWHNEWGDKIMYANVENNALQDAIADRLQKESPIAIRGFHTGKNKSDPHIGLPGLDVEFENGKWIFPIPHDKGVEDNCAFCRVARAFRLHPFGSETDSVMALWFARNACINYGREVFA